MIRKASIIAACVCLVLLAGIEPAAAKFGLKIASIAPEGTALIKELRKASKKIKAATGS